MDWASNKPARWRKWPLARFAAPYWAKGYQPQPVSAEMRPTGAPAPATLPPGVIMVQLA